MGLKPRFRFRGKNQVNKDGSIDCTSVEGEPQAYDTEYLHKLNKIHTPDDQRKYDSGMNIYVCLKLNSFNFRGSSI